MKGGVICLCKLPLEITMTNIELRLETPADYRQVELLTREAFWGYFQPKCDEHYLVKLLRDSDAFIPELDYVAEIDGKLAGNIMYSKAQVVSPNGDTHDVIVFGPLSVLPDHQSRGVGRALLTHTIAEAKRLGYRAILLCGHPDYYTRVGFKRASSFGIIGSGGMSCDAVMAMELYEGALDGISGELKEADVFYQLTPEAVEAYDSTLPPKAPQDLPKIVLLLERLTPQQQKPFIEHEVVTLCDVTVKSRDELMAWEGMTADIIPIINEVLKAHGYGTKPLR